MSSSAYSLYANMLRAREMDRQRRVEEQRYNDQRDQQKQELLLKQQMMTEDAKAQEMKRHLEVAKLMSENAALAGKNYEGGFNKPGVEEYAKAAWQAGDVKAGMYRDKMAQEAAEMRHKAMQLAFERTKELGSSLRSSNVRGTDTGYDIYNAGFGSPEAVVERVPYDERWAPKDGGTGGKKQYLLDALKAAAGNRIKAYNSMPVTRQDTASKGADRLLVLYGRALDQHAGESSKALEQVAIDGGFGNVDQAFAALLSAAGLNDSQGIGFQLPEQTIGGAPPPGMSPAQMKIWQRYRGSVPPEEPTPSE